MADIQPAAYRGHVVQNCQTDTLGIQADVTKARPGSGYHSVYVPPQQKEDRIVKAGEILWERVEARRQMKTGKWQDQQPKVRSALNGYMVVDKNPPAGESEEKAHARRVKQMRREIRIVGVSNKTIKFDTAVGNDTSDHPVAVIHGLITMNNSSQRQIEAHDLIIAWFPEYKKDQFSGRDMHQGNVDDYWNAERRVLETRPLHSIPLFLHSNDDAVVRFTAGAVQHAFFIRDHFVRVGNFSKQNLDALLDQTNQVNSTEANALAACDRPYANFNAYRISMALLEKRKADPRIGRDGLIRLGDAFRERLNDILEWVVGVAITDARPGFRFDCFVMPCFRVRAMPGQRDPETDDVICAETVANSAGGGNLYNAAQGKRTHEMMSGGSSSSSSSAAPPAVSAAKVIKT